MVYYTKLPPVKAPEELPLGLVVRVCASHRRQRTSFASGRKQYTLKDETVRRASPQFRFQTKGGRGRQVCKYVPPCAVARAKELIENGRRYRMLEAEYSRLVTAQSLSSLKKSAGC